MAKPLTSKQLRDNMEDIVNAVEQGEDFLFIYRSRPAFRIVPVRTKVEEEVDQPQLLKSPQAEYVAKTTKRKVNNAAIDAAIGIGTATDVRDPSQDKAILRKRLLEKYG